MNRLNCLLVCMLLFLMNPVTAQTFRITGEAEGIIPGDTLILTHVNIPQWMDMTPDTFFVQGNHTFTITKEIENTGLYVLKHIPKATLPYETCFMGSLIVARPGDDIHVRARVETFTVQQKSGGFYDHPVIAAMEKLEYETQLQQLDLFQKAMQAMKEEDMETMEEYWALWSQVSLPEEYKRLKKEFMENEQESEYVAYLYLYESEDYSDEELQKRMSAFKPFLKETYMAQRIQEVIETRELSGIGKDAPAFTLVDQEGNKLGLNDYKGKYLLLYHWNICPGSMWLQPRLVSFYNTMNKEQFVVLGMTTDSGLTNSLNEMKEEFPEEEALVLLDQPWKTIYLSDGENNNIINDYNIHGVPVLILIGPDGVILERGYHHVFDNIKNILSVK